MFNQNLRLHEQLIDVEKMHDHFFDAIEFLFQEWSTMEFVNTDLEWSNQVVKIEDCICAYFKKIIENLSHGIRDLQNDIKAMSFNYKNIMDETFRSVASQIRKFNFETDQALKSQVSIKVP